jgi:cytochrome d ubiquinol oxidase subunit II
VLAEFPAFLILVGLAAYAVLAGADFGAGFWTLFAGNGIASRETTRDHARHAMGPVWEANHVWLIFVLVVCWTAYPVAFASILSTLSIPLFAAAFGIILRGASYALRGQLDGASGRRLVENVFALSSILTPFALGSVVGSIASGRVPVGNAKGDPFASWFNPTSLLIGVLLVATSSYLAAVYLAADAHRIGEPTLERDFRRRALGAGVVAGALALVGPVVLRSDAPRIWVGLISGGGLAMVALSAAAGMATLFLVWWERFDLARASAALAVAAIVAGFGFAQYPAFLPGLTIEQAAAGRATLVALAVGVVAGALVLVSSLSLLFVLLLHGRFEEEGDPERTIAVGPRSPVRPGRVGTLAVAGMTISAGLLVVSDSGWARVVAVAALFVSAACSFAVVATSPHDSSGISTGT